jgi:uncharacterized caspase-like protein
MLQFNTQASLPVHSPNYNRLTVLAHVVSALALFRSFQTAGWETSKSAKALTTYMRSDLGKQAREDFVGDEYPVSRDAEAILLDIQYAIANERFELCAEHFVNRSAEPAPKLGQ